VDWRKVQQGVLPEQSPRGKMGPKKIEGMADPQKATNTYVGVKD